VIDAACIRGPELDGGTPHLFKAMEGVMLILTGVVGDRVLIGEEAMVQIIEIRGKQVRLGILSPRKNKIHSEKWIGFDPEVQAALDRLVRARGGEGPSVAATSEQQEASR
jgi:carbon storage regulator CsrA